MPLISVPALIAIALSVAIPTAVAALVRQSDRRGRAAAPAPAVGALFVVKNRAWQPILFRVLGIVFLVIGGFFTLISVAAAEDMDGPGPLIAAVCIAVLGAVFLLFAIGIKRFRVDVYPDRLVVRPWFKRTRVVFVHDVGTFRPAQNRFGGLDIRDTDGRMLFTATTITVGFEALVPYLQEHTPRQWSEFAMAYGA